jgi:transposase InsO family protein
MNWGSGTARFSASSNARAAIAGHGCRAGQSSRPGELLHVDMKYLPVLDNRPEFEYAAIDDFSREGAAVIARERSTVAATRFLEQVLAQLPYRVEAVMTDNDMMFTMRFAFHSHRLTRFQQALKSAGIEHRLIRPRSPESNGKVERRDGYFAQAGA